MDNKALIGIGGVLAVFLLFPFVAQHLKSNRADEVQVGDDPIVAAVPAAIVSTEPPYWNNTNIVGTEWEVEWEGNMLKMTVEANGVCYVTHPLMKNITGTNFVEGRWRCEYDKAYIDVAFGTKEYNLVMKIVGDKIIEPRGTPAKRIR